MRVISIVCSLVLLLPCFSLAATIDGRALRVDGELYVIKGTAWNPVAAGDTHPADLDFAGYAAIDIPLMEAMGINTIRTYEPITSTVVLDQLHAAGIKVINSAYNWGGNPVDAIDDDVNAVAGHPAILMWSVGNEWNYNGLYVGLSFNDSAQRVNDVAERIKMLDPDAVVATIYGELPESSLVNQLNHVDVWGINAYRGISFGDLFSRWNSISQKPMFLAEYGADAWNANIDAHDPASQSYANVRLTQEIFDHLVTENDDGTQPAVLGGTFFSWADEWWKAGNPSQQDIVNITPPGGGPYPDATFNEEFWGIVDIDRNPRCGYYNMQALFVAHENGSTFNELPCGDEPPPSPLPTPIADPTPTPVAGDAVRIEAEDFSDAFDTTGTVELEGCQDDGCGQNVGWTADGEWLDYDLSLAPGTYAVYARVASDGGGGLIEVAADGSTISASVGDTGGWQNWTTVSLGNITLTSGNGFRVNIVSANFNLNWIEFVDQDSATPAPTPIPTSTPEPTATAEPTVTPDPTATDDPTPTPDPTETEDPSPTSMPVPTATPIPDTDTPPDSQDPDQPEPPLGGSSGGGAISTTGLLVMLLAWLALGLGKPQRNGQANNFRDTETG